MKTIRIVIAAATLACLGGSALAAGMKKLSTVVRLGQVTAGPNDLKVRAPLGTRLDKSMGGSTGTFAPYQGHSKLNRTRTGLIITLSAGRYFVPTEGKLFEVLPFRPILPQ